MEPSLGHFEKTQSGVGGVAKGIALKFQHLIPSANDSPPYPSHPRSPVLDRAKGGAIVEIPTLFSLKPCPFRL